MNQSIAIITLVSLVVAGCHSPKETPPNNQPMAVETPTNNPPVTVIVEDGINLLEAQFLASQYFTKYLGGCGGTTVTEDKGTHWETQGCVGYAGVPLESPIITEKDTGKTYMKDHPEEYP